MARGESKSKFIKGTNIPKRSGNFSEFNTYLRGIKYRDYRVRMINGNLIVEERTPLAQVMPVALTIIGDPTFYQYTQKWTHTRDGKQYMCMKMLTKNTFCSFGELTYTYREWINTENDFEYKFPEY